MQAEGGRSRCVRTSTAGPGRRLGGDHTASKEEEGVSSIHGVLVRVRDGHPHGYDMGHCLYSSRYELRATGGCW